MLIDAHAHLHMYGESLEPALAELDQHRVFTVAVSMDDDSYRATLALAGGCPWLVATFGVHPWNAHRHSERIDDLRPLVLETPLIGEIGLDFYFVRDRATYPAQRKVFEFFLEEAGRQDKIVNLHTKGAEAEVLAGLREFGVRRSIVHWYSGPSKLVDSYLEAGAYFTVGVEVLTSKSIQRLAKRIPEERVLTESDNPGGWRWLSGQDGMPSILVEVAARLAELRGWTPERLRRRVADNFAALGEDDAWAVRLKALQKPASS